jgi:ADP-heptose:LPS heptosyltransferase
VTDRALQIPYRGRRWLVGAADVALTPLRWRRAATPVPPRRILLLRLERIGDLLMTLDAIAAVRAAAPEATIDLAVGSWNRDLAALIPGISQLHVVDVPWLARDERGDSMRTLIARARAWRGRYDLVVVFEPDIRTNLLAWLTGARQRVGYWTGGGGALLTDAAAYEPAAHVSENAARLVARAILGAGATAADGAAATLVPPDDARRRAAATLEAASGRRIGIHVSGGRDSKQWHLDRFARTAQELAARHDATIIFTGSAADRPMVQAVLSAASGVRAIDVSGSLDLPALAALLSSLDVLITGDTGPMHLAAAVGTPVVALFGPSDPRRYGPVGAGHEVLRVQLPCSPCGQVRLPPARCRGHVPDCMAGIEVERVTAAVDRVLSRDRRQPS